MLSGRHFIFIGMLASAGLYSVKESQQEISLSYKIAKIEQQIRTTKKNIAISRDALNSLQTPNRIMSSALQLDLPVEPASDLDIYIPVPDPLITPPPHRAPRTRGPRTEPRPRRRRNRPQEQDTSPPRNRPYFPRTQLETAQEPSTGTIARISVEVPVGQVAP